MGHGNLIDSLRELLNSGRLAGQDDYTLICDAIRALGGRP